jgi:L-ascorbate metabolism protein UlaG (beta-lactamase superfamily)
MVARSLTEAVPPPAREPPQPPREWHRPRGRLWHTAARVASFFRWIGRAVLLIVGLVVGLAALTAFLGKLFSGPNHHGPTSDHFDGKRFLNRRATDHGGPREFLRWQMHRQLGPWQDRPATPAAKLPARVGSGELRVTFINHATVLIQQDGLNILTDPIWSKRASPVSWIGPARHHPPGIEFDDLPPIDAVIVSHNHYDHMDLPTLRRLQDKHQPRFFVGVGNGSLFVDAGIGPVSELDWWGELPLSSEVTLIGLPTQHFSGRGLFDRDATLWLGYAIKGPAGVTTFAGDTGAGPHFAEIRQHLGPPRLAILPIGAYRPEWFMERVHLSPAQAVDAHDALGARTSLAIHFGTFALGDDGQDEPVAALEAALATHPAPRPNFWHLPPGESRPVP